MNKSQANPIELPAPISSATNTIVVRCYQCSALVQIPGQHTNTIFACGACGVALEIADVEHGITRMPVASLVAPLTLTQGASALLDAVLPGHEIISLYEADTYGQRYRVRLPDGRQHRVLIIDPELAKEPSFISQVDEYAHKAQNVLVPNVLTLNRIVKIDGTVVYISHDPAGYEPLSTFLLREKTLNPHLAVSIIRQLALALEQSAQCGLFHGWLCPEVILVDETGKALLDDLGVPKHYPFLFRYASTPSKAYECYVAPELAAKNPAVDLQTDIFSLGALFFRMITGESIVQTESLSKAHAVMNAKGIRAIRDLKPAIHINVEKFYQQLIAIERKKRFNRYFSIIENCEQFAGATNRLSRQLTEGVSPHIRTSLAEALQPQHNELRPVGFDKIINDTTRLIHRSSSDSTANHAHHHDIHDTTRVEQRDRRRSSTSDWKASKTSPFMAKISGDETPIPVKSPSTEARRSTKSNRQPRLGRVSEKLRSLNRRPQTSQSTIVLWTISIMMIAIVVIAFLVHQGQK